MFDHNRSIVDYFKPKISGAQAPPANTSIGRALDAASPSGFVQLIQMFRSTPQEASPVWRFTTAGMVRGSSSLLRGVTPSPLGEGFSKLAAKGRD